ncbi:uncharacterized protein LOC116306463 isoform X2 [Actinia tenebrosa]|uniref:Uncharacterized protein LOC116306463 isoform X2 n=1 Tax=Actinia tenebrosa TaxID=6105 RepID=A0A6P8IY51_ACTTE|nr:uncharacterized protein LOC116306463 isoform X2 [Actinia tenebrosa]
MRFFFFAEYAFILGMLKETNIMKIPLAMAKTTSIALLALSVVIQGLRISGNILHPKEIVVETGENAIFNFSTKNGNPILAAQFGLKGEGEYLKAKFIIVTQLHGIECGKDFNSSEGYRYRNRIFFVGNITAGRAWFKITNVEENDTNTYQVGVRENTDVYKMYTVKLVVKRKTETSSPTTPSGTTEQTKSKAITANGPIAKIIPKPIEVNRDPPYGLLALAIAITFVYAMYTLYMKTRLN